MLKNNFWIPSVFLCALCSVVSFVSAVSQGIPADMQNEFTFEGKVPVLYELLDDIDLNPVVYSTVLYDSNIQKAILRECNFLEQTDFHLYNALDDLTAMICGKTVAVIGSYNAWYESILLAYGANPIVIDERPIQTTDPRVTYLTQEQYEKNPQQFDLILNITDTARAGLGRYGDPVDPNGDLKLMENLKKMLSPSGKLLLAVPVGPDQLVWNTRRIYGELRLKLLLKNWRVMRYYGFTSEYMFYGIGYRPIFLLQPK